MVARAGLRWRIVRLSYKSKSRLSRSPALIYYLAVGRVKDIAACVGLVGTTSVSAVKKGVRREARIRHGNHSNSPVPFHLHGVEISRLISAAWRCARYRHFEASSRWPWSLTAIEPARPERAFVPCFNRAVQSKPQPSGSRPPCRRATRQPLFLVTKRFPSCASQYARPSTVAVKCAML